MTAYRYQSSRVAGFRQPPNSKRLTRDAKASNPFRVEDHGREGALRLFREHLSQHPEILVGLEEFDALGCTCALDEHCHVDIILQRLHCKKCVHMGNCRVLGQPFPCSDFVEVL